MKAYSRYFFLLLVLSYLSIEEVISWGEDAVRPDLLDPENHPFATIHIDGAAHFRDLNVGL